jgi:hypothetical protein
MTETLILLLHSELGLISPGRKSDSPHYYLKLVPSKRDSPGPIGACSHTRVGFTFAAVDQCAVAL